MTNNYLNQFSDNQDSSSLYIQSIQFLLMYMFQHDQLFTKTDLAKLTETNADQVFKKHVLIDVKEKNIGKEKFITEERYFFTQQQKAIIEVNQHRVLFTSNFGTGKTFLLKSKAKLLGTKGSEKSFFVIFAKKDSFLVQSVCNEFKGLKEHVEVVRLESKYNIS
jgi:hypothetical protein